MIDFNHRRVLVCRRCGKLMGDQEPYSAGGEHFHAKREESCPNDGKTFFSTAEGEPLDRKECEPFRRKSDRRRNKRSLKQHRKRKAKK